MKTITLTARRTNETKGPRDDGRVRDSVEMLLDTLGFEVVDFESSDGPELPATDAGAGDGKDD